MGAIPVVRPPRPPLLAGRDRLLAMHDCGGAAGALARVFANAVAPFLSGDSVRGFHETAILVAGSNPVLAAMAARRATSRGREVLLALGTGPDPWPYDLLGSANGVAMLEDVLGLAPASAFAAPDWRLRRAIRACVESCGDRLSVLQTGSVLSLSRNRTAEELLIHAAPAAPAPATDPFVDGLRSELRSAARDGRVLGVPRGARPTAIFARTVVLVSRLDRFAASTRIDREGTPALAWPEGIIGLGSAAWDPADGSSAARCMVDDIVRAARLLPS